MQNYQLKKETNRYIATVQLQFPDATYNLEAAGKKIESKFKASDDKTGVQPYIYLKKYDSSLTSDDEKLEYANKYFNDVVKRKDALDNAKKDIETKTRAAQNALKAGNEEDCKKLIELKQQAEANLTTLQQNYEVAAKNEKMMVDSYNELVNRINVLESKKDATKAKIKLANVQEKNNKLAAKANSAVVTDAFDKYEHEADRRLARAQAEAELNNGLSADAELVNKYTNSLNESVEDEFEKMKAELGM